MVNDEISASDLESAEATFAEVKADYASGGDVTTEEYRAAKRGLVSLRSAFRNQEQAAGRRSGLVGGDVAVEE